MLSTWNKPKADRRKRIVLIIGFDAYHLTMLGYSLGYNSLNTIIYTV